ncbi:hypothetical protein GCM10010841_26520 [Deinococcus aerophilus]|uniref:DUF4900 domain-containing protein n=1 Tax=Deinococcus aerophilus TaxID=522488 RepID=A0ABQ2GY97_9DEIO|nr:hypothetical protein GCM10010841_26520 [Deinococcus aerophilus]
MLSLAAVLLVVLATYSIVTVNNTRTSASSGNASAGFYASEAALNARAEAVRQKFKGFEVPAGVTPSAASPCQGTNKGLGDFACQSNVVAGRTVTSYVEKGGSTTITIPPGEDFENLTADETPFTVRGQALGTTGNPEAITELTFRSRLVPLFQFAVFFGKDLEFTNTANLNLSGPVHTNGNLFLDAGATLYIKGQTTAAGRLYRGWKHGNNCSAGTVQLDDAGNTARTIPCGAGRTELSSSTTNAFGGRLKRVPSLELPEVAQLQPNPGAQYWDKADIRIVLRRRGSSDNWDPMFVNASKTIINLSGVGCLLGESLGTSTSFRDNREAEYWENGGRDARGQQDAGRANRRMLEIDVRQLLTCVGTPGNASLLGISGLADETDGGLVIYATVEDGTTGIAQDGPNHYAVRLKNAALLQSNNAFHPKPKGITFVSDEAVFLQGNFNSSADRASGWIPASVISDTVNVISAGWDGATRCTTRYGTKTYGVSRTYRNISSYAGFLNDLGGRWNFYTDLAQGDLVSGDAKSQLPLFCRYAGATTIKAGILSATTSSGTIPGPPVQDGEGTLDRGPQSGGVHNMMRFHEDWGSNSGDLTYPGSAVTYTYTGSLVSLSQPLHAFGTFILGNNRYQPPQRNWTFEEQFRRAENLPPLTPRFVYLRQDNFTRQFEQ